MKIVKKRKAIGVENKERIGKLLTALARMSTMMNHGNSANKLSWVTMLISNDISIIPLPYPNNVKAGL